MPVTTEPETASYLSLGTLQVEAGNGKKPKIVVQVGD